MKKVYIFSLVASTLCAAGSVAAVSVPNVNVEAFRQAAQSAFNARPASEFKGVPTLEQLKTYPSAKAKAPESGELPKGAVVETVVYKDFSDWTAGSMQNPDSVNVADDDALYDKLFGADSDWMPFMAYQAGGAMYLGYDEVGDDGPGYVMTPIGDFGGPNVAYRLRVTAMNVNEDAQDQGLQAFFMNQNPGEEGGNMVAASTVKMVYNEWTTCEWIGKTSEDKKYLRAMMFGWKGKVLVKDISFDRIVYAVNTVTDLSLSYSDGIVKASWTGVDDAVSYKVTICKEVNDADVEIASQEVPATSAEWEMAIDENAETYFVKVIAVNAEGEESYPESRYSELAPTVIGDATALPATEVSAAGFTANWEAITSAARTVVFPTQTHTAVEAEEYIILNDDFKNVPLYNTNMNPAMVIPLLGYGNMDMMMSRAGWTTDACIFARMTEDFPALALANMFAGYGLTGYVKSPVYDLSVGNGEVKVSGMAVSAEDDAVISFYLVDEATGEEYAQEDIEVNTDGCMFEVCLSGGRPNSSVKFEMTDFAGEEMILIPMLSVTASLNAGETISGPLDTEFVYAPATSYAFDSPVDENNSYTYRVQGVFKELRGAISDVIEVKAVADKVEVNAAAAVNAAFHGDVLSVSNPSGERVSVMTADGKVLAVSDKATVEVAVSAGIVIVKVGDKTLRLMR